MNENGEVVGTYNENPILNTRVYDVEFPDGDVREYSANIFSAIIVSREDRNNCERFEIRLNYVSVVRISVHRNFA